MKLLSINSVIILLVLCLHTAEAAPRVKNYTLQNHTTLTVDIVPNLGTRFVFPFVLDESDEYVPFTANLTNPAFTYNRDKGRNSFVVTIPPKYAGQTANLFVTVAGYLITIELRTTNDIDSYNSDINFELGDEDRETLVQKGIKERTKVLEAEYKKKFDEIDRLAEQKAIAMVGALALSKATRSGIKEQKKQTLAHGGTIALYVDDAVTYGSYTIFTFELSLAGDPEGVAILDAKLFSTDPQSKAVKPVDAAKDIPQRLHNGEAVRCAITTLSNTLNTKDLLKMQVLTDKGTVEAKW